VSASSSPPSHHPASEALPPELLELAGVMHGSSAFIGPEQVVIDITNHCNNNCLGCWTRSPLLRQQDASPRWQAQEIPTESVLRLLDDLHRLGTRRIRFSGGGEPLIHAGLPRFLSEGQSRGFKVCLTTNGTLLTPELLQLLIDLPLEELTVSLWAATPRTYSRTHPNKTGRTFDRLLGALKELGGGGRRRPRITLAQVLCQLNFAEAERMYDLARQVGAHAVYYTLLDPIVGCTDGLMLNPAQVRQLEAQLLRVEEKNGELPPAQQVELENWLGFKRRVTAAGQQFKGHYDSAVIDTIPCYVGWTFCRILANGDVAPCCRGSHKVLGNINSEGFYQVWHNAQYAEFRHKAKTLSKRDPYFATMACHTTCDNRMHNEQLHWRLDQLSAEEQARLEQFLAERSKGIKP
jgi:MoaA/NifB/PqqE/SkfB family radical SAM enzyme